MDHISSLGQVARLDFERCSFAVIVVEGTFIWLVYGFTRAFSSFLERGNSFGAVWAIATVMLINIVTHFMMVKGIPLNQFQQSWLAWGAVAVFIGVLVIVLAITLADPVIRLIRLDLRFQGRQQETIIEAKTAGLESERIQTAMANRAEWEARQLAHRIEGGGDVKDELVWRRTGAGWESKRVNEDR
jgi:hypothetical protein